MSRLLLDDKPLLLLPSLAKAIGVNEAILIQQLHYWLQESQHIHEGYKWIYNTYEDWNKQFPFWSVKTIRRIITKLENSNLIISNNFNKKNFDKTKWYRINYKQLHSLSSAQMGKRCGQVVQTMRTDCPDDEDNLTRPIPEITSEITSEIEDDEDCAREDEVDGVPSTEPNLEDPSEKNSDGEVSTNPDRIALAIENRYIQRRGSGLYPTAKDLQDICEIASTDITLEDAIKWVDESFDNFKPKYPGDRIKSFAYCKSHILHKAYLKKSRQNAKKGVDKNAKFQKNYGQNDAKQSRPSEETKRLDEIARKKGLITDGEIRDIDCDF